MNFDEYDQAVTLRMQKEWGHNQLEIATWALGLTGEAGEVADIVKKHIGQGHSFPHAKLIEELGDVLWYLSALAQRCGVGLEEIALTNVAKLEKRYPNGFSTEASINR